MPLLKRVKTQGPCFNPFPHNPPVIKRMGIYQYSSPPDSMEKNQTLYCNYMERRLVLVTINLFNYITVFPSHTQESCCVWCCPNVEQKVFILSDLCL